MKKPKFAGNDVYDEKEIATILPMPGTFQRILCLDKCLCTPHKQNVLFYTTIQAQIPVLAEDDVDNEEKDGYDYTEPRQCTHAVVNACRNPLEVDSN